MNCTIAADPDIAGVGVRAAVYAQAIFCVIPSVLLALCGPEPDRNYAAVVDKTYKQGRAIVATMLVTNVALLIVSLYKTAAGTLTRYHATIILYLSWIVFLGALLSAITLSYSHPLRTKAGFIAWLRIVLVPIIHRDRHGARVELHRAQGAVRALFQSRIRWSKVVHTEHHFIFLSIHIFSIGILGVVLFSEPGGFGRRIECDRDVVMWMFNSLPGISGPAIQHFWFAIYVVSLVPVVNILASAFVVVICFGLPLWLILAILPRLSTRFRDLPGAVTRLVIVLPFLAVIILLILSTEETISANTSTNTVGPEESRWGFGQILSIVLLVAPAIETVKRIVVIFTDRPVVFPKFPARDAYRARDHYLCGQTARTIAYGSRREWLQMVENLPTLPAGKVLRDRATNFQLRPSLGPSGTYDVPLAVCATTIQGATVDQVFGVIVPIGMRQQWDSALDFDGVLKRYDWNTSQRYAVMKPESSQSGGSMKPRDYLLVQQVEHYNDGTITITHSTMDPDVAPVGTAMDSLVDQPGHLRSTLHYEGWIIQSDPGGVKLTCVVHLVLEDTIPVATAREMVQRSLSYPANVDSTFQNYGFAPVWGTPVAARVAPHIAAPVAPPVPAPVTQVSGMVRQAVETLSAVLWRTIRLFTTPPAALPGPAAAPGTFGVLEREYMDTDTGRYTATFRAQSPGSVTVEYDHIEREQYHADADVTCTVIEGSPRNFAQTSTRRGEITLTFRVPNMLVELTVTRIRK